MTYDLPKVGEEEKRMNWKDEKATEKQLNYIAEMIEFSEYPLPKFEGTTKGEASEYISRWSEVAYRTLVNEYELRS